MGSGLFMVALEMGRRWVNIWVSLCRVAMIPRDLGRIVGVTMGSKKEIGQTVLRIPRG